ncbi:hypothetical protein SI859A1_02253 [Aurantimonas manganoxydans SI85-9A1]|uniref:Uncharacterized protein n=1 Tax=Aurantimonas manganoxydans (strain ATCC BAA-1229 / DSM 21871 / SI85-9A1) TaxID=287752 RepID=Q1YME4_AURMS|nr:hypothetical protein SI859A1_02253 [Aurantimonas manganoxydans SI85-9A1]
MSGLRPKRQPAPAQAARAFDLSPILGAAPAAAVLPAKAGDAPRTMAAPVRIGPDPDGPFGAESRGGAHVAFAMADVAAKRLRGCGYPRVRAADGRGGAVAESRVRGSSGFVPP